MKRFTSILFFLIGACPLVVTGAEPKKPSGRQAWIVAVAVPDELANPVDIVTGKDTTKILLSKRSVGAPVKISEDGIVRMVRQVPNPKDPEKPIVEILAEAHIPAACNNALVVLVPTEPKEGSALRFETKVQDLAHFKGGDSLYLNASSQKILVELGEEKMELGQGDMQVTKATRPEKAESRNVSYSVKDTTKETWNVISSSMVVLYPTRREIFFFTGDDSIEYHGMTFPVTE